MISRKEDKMEKIKLGAVIYAPKAFRSFLRRKIVLLNRFFIRIIRVRWTD